MKIDKWVNIRTELSKVKIGLDFLNNIAETMKIYDFDLDSLSKGQLYSKIWLVQELTKLNKNLGSIFILGGWYGILAKLIMDSDLQFSEVKSFDIDPKCEPIALNIVLSPKFDAITKDINDINFDCGTVINTACEHMDSSWFFKIPEGTLVALQTTNLDIPDHLSIVGNLDSMKEIFPLTETFHDGELDLVDYKRFMIIGIK